MQEQLSNIRESIANARGSKGFPAAPSPQIPRLLNQQSPIGTVIEECVFAQFVFCEVDLCARSCSSKSANFQSQ